MMQAKEYKGIQTHGWTGMFNPLKKGPVIAKRIWDTLAEANAYLADPEDSAIEGLILTIVKDGSNNGAYIVQKSGDRLVLVRLATGEEVQPLKLNPESEPYGKIENGVLTIYKQEMTWEDESTFN